MAYIFNNISVKQESIITQSAPEQVIWVWEIASEGARWDFGLLSNMPMPEAHEPRVGLAVQLAICNRGCEPEGVFIDLMIHLKNAPSSEPDAGERHVPYTVFKPIKDGINNWVRGIAEAVGNAYDEYQGNSKGGTRGSGEGSVSDEAGAAIGNAIFGNTFLKILEVLLTILDAVTFIISPFISIVSGLISQVADFVIPIIMGAIGNGENNEKDPLKGEGTFNEFIDGVGLFLGISSGVLAIISGILATKGFIDALNDFWGPLWKKQSAPKILITAGIGMIICTVGYIVSMLNIPDNAKNIVSLIFAFGGLIPATLSAIAAIKLPKAKIMDWVATGVAALSFGISVAQVLYWTYKVTTSE